MATISLCMIVKDEEETLARVLQSVESIVDEMIIVDTGSTDRTVEIAKEFSARTFHFEWINDFAAARNYSFSKATQDYILWLDADDILAEADRERFLQLKANFPPHADRITMPYILMADQNGKPVSSLRRNRVVRRACNFQWIGYVHEYLNAFGPVVDSDVCVTHRKQKAYTDRNLSIYRTKVAEGEQLSVRDLYYYANELKDHAHYDEAAQYYERFLDTGQGWIEDNLQACVKLADCYAHLGERRLRLNALLRAFDYDSPRAEHCYALGSYYFEEAKYHSAIVWFREATQISPPQTMGISNLAVGTWLPHLQLCLCYDRIKQYEEACKHNELALQFNPTHSSLLYNRNYFRTTHNLPRPAAGSLEEQKND